MSFKVWDSDDFGANHVISDICQSHDCRDILGGLKEANPNFKATLFTIPGYVTTEILGWANANRDWVQLAWHGFYHLDNYECEKLTYEEFDKAMTGFLQIYGDFFVKGFKAPGWQISDDIYLWLKDNDFWVADQAYNDERRPKDLPVYKVGDNSVHRHTWDCVGNGVYEMFDHDLELVTKTPNWKFVSEAVDENL